MVDIRNGNNLTCLEANAADTDTSVQCSITLHLWYHTMCWYQSIDAQVKPHSRAQIKCWGTFPLSRWHEAPSHSFTNCVAAIEERKRALREICRPLLLTFFWRCPLYGCHTNPSTFSTFSVTDPFTCCLLFSGPYVMTLLDQSGS